MPKCDHGKQLFKAWRETNETYDALLWRSKGLAGGFHPEITITVEEALKQGLAAQRAFLNHAAYCDECRGWDGRDID